MKINRLFLLFLAIVSISIGVASIVMAKTHNKINVDKAEDLVASWVKANRTKTYWKANPQLQEVTTEEIWKKLHVQIFKQTDYTDSLDEIDAYLIKDQRVYPMSVGFGGNGLEDMVVCDLNNDSKLDLAYTYSFGSGLHRTHIAAYTFDMGTPTKYVADTAITQMNVHLKNVDSNADVYISGYKTNDRLGKLVLTGKGTRKMLKIEFDLEMRNKWKKNLWIYGKE